MAEFQLSMRPAVLLLLLFSFALAQEPSRVGVPGCGQRPMDLLLLLDSSGSVGDFQAVREFAAGVVSLVSVGPGALRVGLLSFGEDINAWAGLAEHSSSLEVQQAIMATQHRPGGRDVSQALMALTDMFRPHNGDRPDAPNVALLLTTGPSTANADRVEEEARKARAAGITIFVVALGISDEKEVDQIVGEPAGENKFLLDRPSELPFIQDVVLGEMCSRLDQLQSQRIRQSSVMDLIFLMHFSRKLSRDNFGSMMNFVKETLADANIDSGDVRVGVAVYRKRGLISFHLNQFSTKNDVLAAVDQVSYNMKAGQANAASGIDVVREEMFTAKTGDRPDAPNVVVIVTDENANDDVARLITSSQELRQSGAYIYSVGVGLDNPQELQATASNGNYFALDNFDQLTTAREVIAEQLASLSLGPGATDSQAVHVTRGPGTLELDQGQRGASSLRSSLDADIVLAFQAKKMAKRTFRRQLRPAMVELLRKAEVNKGNVRVALVNFGKDASVIFDLSKYDKKGQIEREIKKLSDSYMSNRVNPGAALELIRTQIFTGRGGDRPNVPNGVILVTDSKANMDQAKYLQEAEALKAAGVEIFTIGIAEADERELSAVSSQPSNAYSIKIRNHKDLSSDKVLDLLSDVFYPLGDVTPAPPPTQAVTLPVTSAPVPDPSRQFAAAQRADIVFAVHFDRGGNSADFDRLKAFLTQMVRGADVDSGNVRIGLVFSGPYTVAALNSRLTSSDLERRIAGLDQNVARRRNFDATGLLESVRTSMFTPANGDRPDAPNGIILITDTPSNQGAQQLQQEAAAARAAGITVYTMGVGLQDKGELENLASSPRTIFTVSNFQELQSADNVIKREVASLRSGSGTRGPTTTPKETVFRFTNASAVNQLGLVDSLTSASQTSKCCDVLLIVDVTVPEADLKAAKAFAQHLTFLLNKPQDRYHTAAITMASSPEIQWGLNRLQSPKDQYKVIDRFRSGRGPADRARAFQAAQRAVFNPRRGDREDVANVVVFVSSDGAQGPADAKAVKALQSTGAQVVAVQGGSQDASRVQSLASGQSQPYSWSLPGTDDATGVAEEIYTSFQSRQGS